MIGRRYYTCDCCEARIDDGDNYYEIDGECLCESCAAEWLEDHKYTLDVGGAIADYDYDLSYESAL